MGRRKKDAVVTTPTPIDGVGDEVNGHRVGELVSLNPCGTGTIVNVRADGCHIDFHDENRGPRFVSWSVLERGCYGFRGDESPQDRIHEKAKADAEIQAARVGGIPCADKVVGKWVGADAKAV